MVSAVHRSPNPNVLDTGDSDGSELAAQIQSYHSVVVVDDSQGDLLSLPFFIDASRKPGMKSITHHPEIDHAQACSSCPVCFHWVTLGEQVSIIPSGKEGITT